MNFSSLAYLTLVEQPNTLFRKNSSVFYVENPEPVANGGDGPFVLIGDHEIYAETTSLSRQTKSR